MVSTCFEYYLLILRRHYTGKTILVQPTDITGTQYTKFRLYSTSWGWASNARNIQRPLILNKLVRKCITLVSLYWSTMMHGQQNIKCVESSLLQLCLWFGAWLVFLTDSSNEVRLDPIISTTLSITFPQTEEIMGLNGVVYCHARG
jgi:hypothetical protein